MQYYRDFEYPADGTKHYDGTLDYNNIHKVIADGKAKFNGEERYGGKADSDYIEQVLDFEELPIATRTRLGYVIADENFDIDESGLITLPQRFKSCMTALESGSTTKSVNDTTLENQQLFPLTSTEVNERDVKCSFYIANDEAVGLAIREFGLFCSDGTMFSHRVRQGVIEKLEDIEILGYWILHF